MNSIAKVGKTTLKTLFLKLNVFGELKIDLGDQSITYPKLPEKKEVILEKNGPEMEEGGYEFHRNTTRGCTRRENRCKVFTWSAVIGLIEIPLEQFGKQDTLFGMICVIHRQIKPVNHHMAFKTPTHIVVVKNNKWFKLDDTDGPTLGNILEQNELETISVYSIEQVWQQMIWERITT